MICIKRLLFNTEGTENIKSTEIKSLLSVLRALGVLLV
jgi:hypothetical protein